MMGSRLRLRVQGIVQGVGFRPFVYGLATRAGLGGHVGNDAEGVFIEVEGPDATLADFRAALQAESPPLARIESVQAEVIPPCDEHTFVILESRAGVTVRAQVPPDVGLCADCLRELFDPQNRRYRYPFINCTHCGPRFSIIQAIPYDRASTTMSGFVMCDACAAEYHDPGDRRFHAQPIACPVCGPQVWWEDSPSTHSPAPKMPVGGGFPEDSTGVSKAAIQPGTSDRAIAAAQGALRAGQIVAVKGLGGFHLACDATNDAALARLRGRKGRVDKPFAVMVRDVAQARDLAWVDEDEAALLESHNRPILLLRKRADSPLSDGAAPGNPCIGIMLPYTPLHYLLLEDRPLVMTSGNLSGEPIAYQEDEARQRLGPLVDGFLMHNRPIQTPCDDSVLRRQMPVRRSRGYAPFPIRLPLDGPSVLAIGGELKNTFCLTHNGYAFLSQHIGDMENLETLQAFERAQAHLRALYQAEPTAIVCDLHPNYLTTQWAADYARRSGLPLIQVQHHHAHIAAVMAEHGLDGQERVIGVCLDGTGYGTDGSIWGGEILLADYDGFERLACLKPVPLPGGDAAVKQPYRMALAHLWAAGIDWEADLPPVAACPSAERRLLLRQLEAGVQTVPTTSMGRLFDAVATLVGLRQTVTYEAQAAIELEGLIDASVEAAYPFDYIQEAAPPAKAILLLDPAPLLRALVADLRAGVGKGVIAARFHNAVVEVTLAICLGLRDRGQGAKVAFSGGVFQNEYLMSTLMRRLRAHDFTVLAHQAVPPNDGGLALGQAVLGMRRLSQNRF
jgi:hydrogenase maturation protein HypF